MSERFTRLFQLGEDLYSSESPVLVVAGALLKDGVTDSLVIQMKFQNLSSKTIVAARVKFRTYDVAKKELPASEEYQYLDLNMHTGECWGTDKAIIVSEMGVRSFSVEQVSVLFSGFNTWKTTDFTGAMSLPKGIPLDRKITDNELVTQYQIAVNASARFFPSQHGDVWRCSCGAVNRDARCHNCKVEKSVIFSALDLEVLRSGAQKRIEKEKEAEAKKEAQRKKQAKTIKKVAMVGVPIIAVVLFFTLWLYPCVLEPNSRYSNACNLVEAGKYDDAIEIFEGLGDYRDAADRIKATWYKKAEELENNGKVNQAITIFENLGDYKNSRLKVSELTSAVQLLEYERGIQDIKAGHIFSVYTSWKEKLTPDYYAKAVRDVENICDEWLDAGKYTEANTLIEVFSLNNSWVQSKLFYLMGKEALEQEELEKAHQYFVDANGFEDSDEYLKNFGHILSNIDELWTANYEYSPDGDICKVQLVDKAWSVRKYTFTVEHGYLTAMRNEGQGFWYEYSISYSDNEIIIEKTDSYNESGYSADKFDLSQGENGLYLWSDILETNRGIIEASSTVKCHSEACGIVHEINLESADLTKTTRNYNYSLSYGKSASNRLLPYQEIIFQLVH